jgi:deferrochelatase/peroxidase EfeB
LKQAGRPVRSPPVDVRSTRRGFLSAAGVAGLSAGIGLGAEAAGADPRLAEAGSRSAAVGFFGPHQAGIATPTQEYLQFASLDVVSDSVGDLRSMLSQLSAAAAALARGAPVGALQTADAPPVDTGESVGLGPARTTVTFGFGPSVFARRRFGLQARRPAPLVELPPFAGDALLAHLSGGDLGLQVCADDPQVAFHAVHDLIRLAAPVAVPRWLLAGFGRTANSHRQTTPRNLMGFKDGTGNLKVEDRGGLERFVWAGARESPAWMHGGSYMVVRRIAMNLGTWDDTGLTQQERTFGRHKLSGAPLGGVHEHDPVKLGTRSHGEPVIPADAHVRLASPEYNRGEQILRRGYSYVDGIEAKTGSAAGGLLFICFQRDPRKGFVAIQRRLAGADALNQHITHVGSAIFACPPGAGPGGFVGETLFA